METIASESIGQQQQTPPPPPLAGQSESSELVEIRALLWGNQLSDTVFARWSQGQCKSQFLLTLCNTFLNLSPSTTTASPAGFEFSEVESTALVQYQGGPCAVIAPVQAYLLQSLLQETASGNVFSSEVGGVDCAFPTAL